MYGRVQFQLLNMLILLSQAKQSCHEYNKKCSSQSFQGPFTLEKGKRKFSLDSDSGV